MTVPAQKLVSERTADFATEYALCTRGLSASEGREQWCEALDSSFCEMDVSWPRPGNLFNGDISRSGVDDMLLSHVSAEPHRVTRSPSLIDSDGKSDYLLILALAGDISLHQSGRTALLSGGSFSVVDSTQPFVIEGHTEFEQLVLNAPRELLMSRLREDSLESAIGIAYPGNTGISGMLSRFLNDLASTGPELSDRARASTANIVLDLFATSIDEHTAADNPTARGHQRDLLRVQQEINRTLHIPGLSLNELADELGMSVRYIHKLFEPTGQTPRGYLTEQRMKRARWLLLDSDHAVADISERVGYRDVSHFSRAVREHFGMSPSKFRASGRASAATSH